MGWIWTGLMSLGLLVLSWGSSWGGAGRATQTPKHLTSGSACGETCGGSLHKQTSMLDSCIKAGATGKPIFLSGLRQQAVKPTVMFRMLV